MRWKREGEGSINFGDQRWPRIRLIISFYYLIDSLTAFSRRDGKDFHPLLSSRLISPLEAACSPSFSPIFSRLFSRATTPQLHSAWVGSITIYRRQSRRKLRGVGSLFARPSLATRGLMPPAVLCDIPLRGWPGIVLLSRLPASR